MGVMAVLGPTAGVAGTTAQGAESGVVVNGPTGLSLQSDGEVAGLGVAWVRGFVPWTTFEPTRGHLSENQVSELETGLAGLPKGAKVILDVVGTPPAERGTAHSAMPPRDPSDYGPFVAGTAHSLAGA